MYRWNMTVSLILYFTYFCVIFAENATTRVQSSHNIHNINDRSESSPSAVANLYEKSDSPPPVCYGIMGCFGLDSSWYDRVNRPLNVMPSPPDRIRTRFVLYTRISPLQGSSIFANSSESALRVVFNPKLLTKFYIHGYGSSGNEPHVKAMISNLLVHGDYNVVVVHWGDGAFPSYMQAVANIRVVGREIAHLINVFKERLGVNPSNVHIIGHSLGAHAAGYAGELTSNLGRITGLDPARPFFSNMPNHVRLDPTDANFVEAIHTDTGALGFGIAEPIGQLDFYPNGGAQQQGCGPSSFKLNNLISSVMDSLGCNHQRAIHLYSDSLLPNPYGCEIMAFECSDSKAFGKGECSSCGSSDCPLFGPKSIGYKPHGRQNVKLYFQAGPKAPFCRFHFFVTIDVGRNLLIKPTPTSVISLMIVGEKSTREMVVFRPSVTNPLHGGKSLTLIYTDETEGEYISKVELKWDPAPGQAVPLGFSNIEHITINSVILKAANSKRMRYPIRMCPGNLSTGLRGEVALGGRLEFTVTNCNN